MSAKIAADAPHSVMRAATVKAFGDIEKVITMTASRKRPSVKKGSGTLLIKVLACSLSPGDCRMIGGHKDLFCTPEKCGTTWPYVPGLDVHGVIEEVDPQLGSNQFAVGDEVVATWDLVGLGGMAEYALVQAAFAAVKPKSLKLSPVEGAALANSASHALKVFERAKISAGDRVMVLGGSGGVGTSLVQLIRNAKASFLACTSTEGALMTSLGVDMVINYQEKDWTEVEDFQLQPFDVVIDLANGVREWRKARRMGKTRVLKPGSQGGRFVAVVFNEWHIEVHSYAQLAPFLLRPLARQLSSWFTPWFRPAYRMYIGSANGESIQRVLGLVAGGQLRAVVDERGPFPFTEEGVKAAFRLQESRHAHGKVVVDITQQ